MSRIGNQPIPVPAKVEVTLVPGSITVKGPLGTLSRSYELEPANPTTAVNLSEVLYKRGEYERARFYIRRVNTKEELASAQTLWLAVREGQIGKVRLAYAQLDDDWIPLVELAKGQLAVEVHRHDKLISGPRSAFRHI